MTAANFKKWNLYFRMGHLCHCFNYLFINIRANRECLGCGEYISTSVKLEVGHPPGAPLFQMLGAFFAMFTSSLDSNCQNGKLHVRFSKCLFHFIYVLDYYELGKKISI